MHLESLEPRLLPSGIPSPQVEMVYLSPANAGSLDGAFAVLAAEQNGHVAASVTLPTWESTWGPANAVRLGLLLGQIPYQGTSTVLVVVAPPGDSFIPYHELLPVFGGQVPIEVTPGDAPGHPEFSGASYDFAAITQGYFESDPPPPYYSTQESLPGVGVVTVDYVTGRAAGPDSQGELQAPNILAADWVFLALI